MDTIILIIGLIGAFGWFLGKWSEIDDHILDQRMAGLIPNWRYAGRPRTLADCGGDREEELRVLATGAFLQPQMTREDVLRTIEKYGWERVKRFNKQNPYEPISMMSFYLLNEASQRPSDD